MAQNLFEQYVQLQSVGAHAADIKLTWVEEVLILHILGGVLYYSPRIFSQYFLCGENKLIYPEL